jgi:hypothetical protein
MAVSLLYVSAETFPQGLRKIREFGNSGIQEFRNFGILEFWNFGILEFWNEINN